MKVYVFISFLLIAGFVSCRSRPEVKLRQAGGTGLSLMPPTDVEALGKLHMESEHITIQYAPGYAVVKAQYDLRNRSSQWLQCTMGFPYSDAIITADGHEVRPGRDAVYNVFLDGYPMSVIEEAVTNSDQSKDTFHTWVLHAAPGKITRLEIWSLVPTSGAYLLTKDVKQRVQAFVYSSDVTKYFSLPVKKSTVTIQLQGNLTTDSIRMQNPTLTFTASKDKRILTASETDVGPDDGGDIVITSTVKQRPEDFQKITGQGKEIFKGMDEK